MTNNKAIEAKERLQAEFSVPSRKSGYKVQIYTIENAHSKYRFAVDDLSPKGYKLSIDLGYFLELKNSQVGIKINGTLEGRELSFKSNDTRRTESNPLEIYVPKELSIDHSYNERLGMVLPYCADDSRFNFPNGSYDRLFGTIKEGNAKSIFANVLETCCDNIISRLPDIPIRSGEIVDLLCTLQDIKIGTLDSIDREKAPDIMLRK